MSKEELRAEIARLRNQNRRDAEEIDRLRAELCAARESAHESSEEANRLGKVALLDAEDIASLRAELAAFQDSESIEIITLRTEIARLRAIIEKAVSLYETYGLLAQHIDCGEWVNEARAALAPRPEGKGE